MSARALPPREAAAGILLAGLLAGALWWGAAERPGPGPLALATSVIVVHAALLSPALGRGPAAWGLVPLLLGAPALAACGYGHPARALAGSALLVLLAALCGVAARALGRTTGRLYPATMTLVLAAPFALAHLAEEFGPPGAAAAWRALSPVGAAGVAAGGAWPPAAALLLLAAWPVAALALRGGGPR